ncbi:putative phage tail tape measure protein [Selenomonas ruminantium subsp. lactilytica TAM6421]|uniref:Putative phage tail tape measure protein n=1 Tax=Selenomonas ruminantium subsp. lactilytica (strain NBRC 103574 / TAM6421) TaxID=927704 RepID=I0GRY5_SELRL|nr:hypothetical protein [Selenomonas ruminantium]BAL83522.1 putative phage tail tape measure protein [Selenomonas ruminantium subsp. lactilytica TAM6421]
MAKGQSIEELYIGLGLDISELQLGFELAGKTVNQTISRLNSENKQVKLKADIDLAKLEGAGSAIDKLNVKEQSLTRQIDIQKQKLDILANAYKSAQNADKAKGLTEESSLTRGAHTNYLRQAQEVEKLNAALRKVQAEQAKIGAGAQEVGKIAKASQTAKAGIDGLSKGYGTLTAKATAFMAIATTGAGLFNITNASMQAGENLYKLTQRLHLSTAEAGQLSRLFSVAGISIQGIIPFFSQLDKKILSSKNGVDETSSALRKFGVRLTDTQGNLLPINQQLDQLAKGYEKAAQAGKLEEFQAQVLGRRGAELIPLLEDYNDNMRIASSIKTTGLLNPKEAHELSLEWRRMKAEAGQLQSAMGASLMPIAKDVMPEVADGLKELVNVISSNKDTIKETIENWGYALKVLGEIAAFGAEKIGKLIGLMRDGMDEMKWLAKEHPFALRNGLSFGPLGSFALGQYYRNDYEQYKSQQKTYKDIAEGKDTSSIGKTFSDALNKGTGKIDVSELNKYSQLTGQTTDFVKRAWDNTMPSLKKVSELEKENTRAADENAKAQDKAREAMEWRASAAGQLSEAIYKLTHNDIENAQHAMYVQAEKAKAAGVSDDLINQFVNAQSGKIAEEKFRNVTAPMAQAFKTDLQNQLDDIDLQAMDFVQKGASQEQAQAWANARKSRIRSDWDRQVAEQIDSIWKSEYQNQLDRIEREKQAWIQKGLSEVKATQWAEEQKKQIQQNTVRQMFQQQRKYLEAYRDAIASGKGMQGAINAVRAQMRKDAGIKDSDWTTPSEIAGFQNALKAAQSSLIPIYEDSVRSSMVQIMRGNQSEYILPDKSGQAGVYDMSNVTASMDNLGDHIDNATKAIDTISQGNQPTTQNINLNVNVNGFTDGSLQDKFVQAGAEVIANALPDAKVNLSY